MKDSDEVMYSRLHLLNNRSIIVKIWSLDFRLSKEALQIILTWMKFSNLPWIVGDVIFEQNLWQFKIIFICWWMHDKGSYNLFCKSVDRAWYNEDLSFTVKLEDPNGKIFKQMVIHERIPTYCPKCLHVGHKCLVNNQNTGPILRR